MATKDSTQVTDLPYTLVVAHPFADYERGAAITDPTEVAAVLAGENANHVRKVNK